jgi:hypothetical protein
MLIGLVGPARSHKTWIKKLLTRVHGFQSIHVGKPVKHELWGSAKSRLTAI